MKKINDDLFCRLNLNEQKKVVGGESSSACSSSTGPLTSGPHKGSTDTVTETWSDMNKLLSKCTHYNIQY